MPPLKLLMLSASGLATGVIGAAAVHRAPSLFAQANVADATENSNEPDVAQPDDVLSDEDEARLALQAIDDMTAHPDDPQRPASIPGVDDRQLAAVPTDKVRELIEMSLPFAEANPQQPRYLFGLGRAAFLHGDDDFARELLGKASKAGSAAADGYLAKLAGTDEDALSLLDRASARGFKPASSWKQSIIEAKALTANAESDASQVASKNGSPIDFTSFKHGELLKALYEGRLEVLRDNPLLSYTYVMALNEAVTDVSEVLFYVEDKEIVNVGDPGLTVLLNRKMMSSRRANEQTVEVGITSSISPLVAMYKSLSNGGSLMDSYSATQTSMAATPAVVLNQFRQESKADGRRFAFMFDKNREAFDRIYSSIKRFANE